MNRPNHEPKQPQDAETPSGAKLNRRAFVRLGAVGAALGGLPLLSPATTARAAESPAVPPEVRPPLPVVDARFPCRIADGIWLIPDKRIFLVPNIGIVEGSRSVLVIDSGLTPDSGRGVLAAAPRWTWAGGPLSSGRGAPPTARVTRSSSSPTRGSRLPVT